MPRESFKAEFLGHTEEISYSDKSVVYSLISLRFVMAWIFLQAGIEKLLDPTWSAESFLLNAVPEANPFVALWPMMAGNPIVDGLVVYGQIGIGLALLLGLFFRFAALMGGLQMLLFWAAHLEAGLLQGLPVDHGYFINSNIVYIAILFGLGVFNAGKIYGLDQKIEQVEIVRKHPKLRYLLG